ncbi:MAG: carboxypeptidase-like regulatory domain-containing protein [Gemmatimonadaceae bacterium]
MRSTLRGWIPVTLAVCFASTAAAQSVFFGSVVADGDPSFPLASAEITIPELNLGARTDSLGKFVFNGIPKGVFRVNIHRVGYNSFSLDARFSGADTLAADFALIPITISLDTVNVVAGTTVRGKFLEFEDRRTHGGGAFLTRTQLEKQKDRQLGEIVAGLPGVRVSRYGAESAVASSRWSGGQSRGGDAMDRRKGAQRGCYSQVYIDNVRVFASGAGEALFNINSIPPSTIQGIEYYASRDETPIQYASDRAECGTMLIWTRID